MSHPVHTTASEKWNLGNQSFSAIICVADSPGSMENLCELIMTSVKPPNSEDSRVKLGLDDLQTVEGREKFVFCRQLNRAILIEKPTDSLVQPPQHLLLAHLFSNAEAIIVADRKCRYLVKGALSDYFDLKTIHEVPWHTSMPSLLALAPS